MNGGRWIGLQHCNEKQRCPGGLLRYNRCMNVLVVEDEKEVAGLIRRGLEEQAFCVEVSHNGAEAFGLATTRQYDVIVLDSCCRVGTA